MSLADELQNMSDEELGRLAAPSSKKLGFFSKLGNALAGRRGLGGDLFGTDSESIGRQIRSQLIAREAAADFDDIRAEKRKQADILGLLDVNDKPGVQFGEIPLTQQSRLRSEGLAPKKTQDISNQVLGPTRSLFQDVMKQDESGEMIPDEFGGLFGSRQDVGLSPTGKKAIGSDQGTDLLSALVGGDQIGQSTDPQGRQGVEQIARQFDPGLQASQEVEDPDATLPSGLARQVFESHKTDLSTARSHETLMSVEQAQELVKGTALASGASEEDAQLTAAAITEPLPLSSINQYMNKTGTGFSNLASQDRVDERQLRQQAAREAVVSRQIEARDSLFEKGVKAKLETGTKFLEMRQEHDLLKQARGFDNEVDIEILKSGARLNEGLTKITARQAFTAEQKELDRSAAIAQQVLRGEQQFDLSQLNHFQKVAQDVYKGASSKGEALTDFYRDLARTDPELAAIITTQMSQAPTGSIDPLTEKAVAQGMVEAVNDFIVGTNVTEDIRHVLANTFKKYGTTEQKLSGLDSLMLKWSPLEYPQATPLIEKAKEQLISNVERLNATKKSLVEVNLPGSATEREEIKRQNVLISSIQTIRGLMDPSLTGPVQGNPTLQKLRQFFNGVVPFANLDARQQTAITAAKTLEAELRHDLLGVAMNANEIKVTFGAFPDMTMGDEQYMASLDVAERSAKDVRDYTEANIEGNVEKQNFIKDRIVDRSRMFQLQFSGSKEDYDKAAKDVANKLIKSGLGRAEIVKELAERGVK